MSRIKFFVPGHPLTQGSMKGFVRQNAAGKHVAALTHSNPGLAQWRMKVTAYAQEAKGKDVIDGPVGIALAFYFKRPAYHYLPVNSRRTQRALSDRATPRPLTSDVDKLIRSILDSLTDAQVWVDDGQVVFVSATKWWADTQPEGVDITVGPIISPLRSPA